MNIAQFIQREWSEAFGPERKERAARLTVVRAIDLYLSPAWPGRTRVTKASGIGSSRTGRTIALATAARSSLGRAPDGEEV
jgi:hypothetical protein